MQNLTEQWKSEGENEPDDEQKSSKRLKTTDEISWRPIKTWRSSRSGAVYPISQSIFINEVEYGIIPLMNNQEIDATQSTGNYYWEGAVSMTSGELKIGIGYLELTGYAAPLLIGN